MKINLKTHVSVHCYAGDGHQVAEAIGLYLHHRCPLTVISPVDSRVIIPHIDCRFAGQREGSVRELIIPGEPTPRTVTAGPIANQRQIEQLKLLLSGPAQFFFMNDADSFCLSPELPRYLYERPEVLWCNYVEDTLEINKPGYADYPDTFPHYAAQPPYFTSRRTLERMVAVADQVKPNEVMPWIDHFMLQLAFAAGVPVERFKDSVASDVDRYPENLAPTLELIRHEGRVFVHSSKSPKTWRPMMAAHKEFVQRTGGRKA